VISYVLGNQARPKLFDLNIEEPTILYEEVIEVDERVILNDPRCLLNKEQLRTMPTSTNESVFVFRELDTAQLEKELERVLQKGIKSLAVVFMHSVGILQLVEVRCSV
jgi:5-oxoprolinase (ATP-hydrolysing)